MLWVLWNIDCTKDSCSEGVMKSRRFDLPRRTSHPRKILIPNDFTYRLPSLKLTGHLKIDGWNTIVSFWGPTYFQGGELLVLGSVVFIATRQNSAFPQKKGGKIPLLLGWIPLESSTRQFAWN